MTNPEQALQHIADAIQNRQHQPTTRWAIVWDVTAFKCVPILTATKYETVFLTLSESNILHGLSQAQWNHLKHTVSNFLHQKGFS